MAEMGTDLSRVRRLMFRRSSSEKPSSDWIFMMMSISRFSVLNLPMARSESDEDTVWAMRRLLTPRFSARARSTWTRSCVSPPSRSLVTSSTLGTVLRRSMTAGAISVSRVKSMPMRSTAMPRPNPPRPKRWPYS